MLAEFPLVNYSRVLQEPRVSVLFLCVCLAQGLSDDVSMPEEHEELNVAQSRPTLCDPMGYTGHGILHGQNTGVGSLSLLWGIFPTQGWNPGLPPCRQILYQLSHHRSPKNTGVGSISLLQGTFPTQESNQGLLHCRRILYQLSCQESPPEEYVFLLMTVI